MKKHLMFSFFQIKSTFGALPRLLLCLLILSGIVFSIGFLGVKNMRTDKKAITANIEVVIPPNDLELFAGFQIFTSMDSMKSVAKFHPNPSEEDAFITLENGKAVAVVILPFGFVDSVLDGINYPARVIMPPNSGIEATMFYAVIDAAVKSVAYVQSASNALTDLIDKHELGNELRQNASDILYNVNIDVGTQRAVFYKTNEISATGNTGAENYFFSSALVLLIALCGLSVTGYFTDKTPSIFDAMKTNKISKGYIRFSEFFSVGIIFSILFIIIGILGVVFITKGKISFTGILAMLLVIFSVVSFIMFICIATDGGISCTLILFLFCALLIYACGRILPSVFLPEGIAKVGEFLPMKHWCNIVEGFSTGTILKESVLYSLAYLGIFLSGSIGITYLKGRIVR